MIYLVISLLCDKGVRKLYQTVTHVIDMRQESQLIALPRDDKGSCGIGIRCVVLQREKERSRMSQDVGMQADSNAPPLSRSHRLCAFGFVTVARKLRNLCCDLGDHPRSFAWTILARPQTRARESANFRRSRIPIIAPRFRLSYDFASDFYHFTDVPTKISSPPQRYDGVARI